MSAITEVTPPNRAIARPWVTWALQVGVARLTGLGGWGRRQAAARRPSVGLALEQCRGIPYVTDTLRTGGFVRFREPQIFAGVLICAGGAALTQWWGRQGMQPCTSG